MSVIAATEVTVPGVQNRHAVIYQWGPCANGDTLTPIQEVAALTDRSVQVEGTLGGATVVISGSNDSTTGADGNFETLLDNSSTTASLSFAANGMKGILTVCRWIKATQSGGGGTTSFTVTVIGVRRGI